VGALNQLSLLQQSGFECRYCSQVWWQVPVAVWGWEVGKQWGRTKEIRTWWVREMVCMAACTGQHHSCASSGDCRAVVAWLAVHAVVHATACVGLGWLVLVLFGVSVHPLLCMVLGQGTV